MRTSGQNCRDDDADHSTGYRSHVVAEKSSSHPEGTDQVQANDGGGDGGGGGNGDGDDN